MSFKTLIVLAVGVALCSADFSVDDVDSSLKNFKECKGKPIDVPADETSKAAGYILSCNNLFTGPYAGMPLINDKFCMGQCIAVESGVINVSDRMYNLTRATENLKALKMDDDIRTLVISVFKECGEGKRFPENRESCKEGEAFDKCLTEKKTAVCKV